MPIVNGQEAVCGLVLDGHFGWHNHVRMLEVAEGFGWEIDDELRAVMTRYDSGWKLLNGFSVEVVDLVRVERDALHEIIFEAMDEAERWLNDHTHGTRKCDGADVTWGEVDGAWFLGDGTIVPDDEVQTYSWGWYDGEFFLSPVEDLEPTCN